MSSHVRLSVSRLVGRSVSHNFKFTYNAPIRACANGQIDMKNEEKYLGYEESSLRVI